MHRSQPISYLEVGRKGGWGMLEMLVSLAIASLLLAIMIQLYLATHENYKRIDNKINQTMENMMAIYSMQHSILRAGFTPCRRVDHLFNYDNRSQKMIDPPFGKEQQGFSIRRMSDSFYTAQLLNAYDVTIPEDARLKQNQIVLIADCFHAEVTIVEHMTRQNTDEMIERETFDAFDRGQKKKKVRVRLKFPLHYHYEPTVYIGKWEEERFFIKDKMLYFYAEGYSILSKFITSLQVEIRDGAILLTANSDDKKEIPIFTHMRLQ